MKEVSIIGLDLAKNVFQAHGAGKDGSVVFRRKLSRAQLLKFLGEQPSCVVAMEACLHRRPAAPLPRHCRIVALPLSRPPAIGATHGSRSRPVRLTAGPSASWLMPRHTSARAPR